MSRSGKGYSLFVDRSETRRRARTMDGVAMKNNKKENGEVTEDDMLLGERENIRIMFGMSLGHILFRSPTTVMAFVNHWMSWRMKDHETDHGPSAEDAFDSLIFSILNDGVDLQMKLRSVLDRKKACKRASFELSVAYNYDSSKLSYYALSEPVLVRAARLLAGEMGELRLRTTILYLFACNGATSLFNHSEPGIDWLTTHFKNFPDNDLLEICQDRSALFVALGVYLMRFLEQQSAHDAGGACDEKMGDEEGACENEEARVACQAGRQLLDVYGKAVIEVYERCSRLRSARVSIDEELCQYHPTDSSHSNFVRGIPLRVVENESLTLLWLKWAWETLVQPGREPMLAVMTDLWLAKSTVLIDSYLDFFENEKTPFDDCIEKFTEPNL